MNNDRFVVVSCVVFVCLDTEAWPGSCTWASCHSIAFFVLDDGASSMLSTQPVRISAPSYGTLKSSMMLGETDGEATLNLAASSLP